MNFNATTFYPRLLGGRSDLRVGWTQHGYSTIEVPRDCKIVCRDGKRTVKGVDWEDSFYRPAKEGNKVIRLLPDRDAYHLTVISCYRTETTRLVIETLLCVGFGILGTWFLIWAGYNMTGALQNRGR